VTLDAHIKQDRKNSAPHRRSKAGDTLVRNYFMAYHRYLEIMSTLSDSEVGRLFKACLIYSETEEQIKLKGNERFVFPTMKHDIDKNRTHYLSKENHPNWKGGITPQNTFERNCPEYKAWRTAVYQRDNYTCQKCGAKGKIQAHHRIPFSVDKSLRLEVSNGITLCKNCHKEIHKRGGYKQCLTE
jgi:hypothetical protein